MGWFWDWITGVVVVCRVTGRRMMVWWMWVWIVVNDES